MGEAGRDDAAPGARAERAAEDAEPDERGERTAEDAEPDGRAGRTAEDDAAGDASPRPDERPRRTRIVMRGSELRSAAAARGSELRSHAAHRAAEVQRTLREMDVPWARCRAARLARETILQVALAPLMDLYVRMRVTGREQLRTITPPVVLVANHSSHLDTPTILRALPLAWRQRTAVAAAADYFYNSRAIAGAVALAFNTVPIMRRGGGPGGGVLAHVDRLIEQRWNLLMYPEGTRSREGALGKLRPGAALIAREHNIPIVPVRLEGTFEAMPPGRLWPRRTDAARRHDVAVSFGPPLWASPDEEGAAIMERIRPYLTCAPGPAALAPDL